MRKIWIRILIVYIVYILFWLTEYPFLYWNTYLCRLWEWIDPAYLLVFFVVGIVCCVWVGRQSIREFSGNVFNRESSIVLMINVVYALLVLEIGSFLGDYKINWAGVVYQSILCIGCVGLTEEWIFRGFMVTQLKKVLKSKKAVVLISSALFAMMHLPTYFRWAMGFGFINGFVFHDILSDPLLLLLGMFYKSSALTPLMKKFISIIEKVSDDDAERKCTIEQREIL